MKEAKLKEEIMYLPEIYPANLITCEIFDTYHEDDGFQYIEFKIVKSSKHLLLVRELEVDSVLTTLAKAAGLKAQNLEDVTSRKVKSYKVLRASTL